MIEFLDADEVARRLSPAGAVGAIRAALLGGLDPSTDPARTIVDVEAGQLLLMPSSMAGAVGAKVVGLAPGNAVRGLPRIHGLYVLLDAQTLAPRAVLDGAALTTLRTPAVSVAAARAALRERPDVLVFGAGPQGVGHVATLRDVLGELGRVRYAVRDPARVTVEAEVLRAGDVAVDAALRAADIVVCATSAREPLFDGALVAAGALVIAVGSHEAAARELDGALLGRSQVIVEDRATALREAGEVVLAIASGHLDAEALVTMKQIVTGTVEPALDRPVIVKTVGMSWQDLVVASSLAS